MQNKYVIQNKQEQLTAINGALSIPGKGTMMLVTELE